MNYHEKNDRVFFGLKINIQKSTIADNHEINKLDVKNHNNFSSYLGGSIGRVLEFVRQVFLMEVGKDIERLFDKLDMYEKCDDENMVNSIFQESIKDVANQDYIGLISDMEIVFPDNLIIPQYIVTDITALDHISINFTTVWPLNMIFDQKVIQMYNQCYNFLLKIHRATYVLSKKDLWNHAYTDLNAGNKRDYENEDMEEKERNDIIELNSKIYDKYQHQFFLFQHKLLHFAKNLEIFIKARVISHCTAEFKKSLSDVKNMDMLIRLHSNFLNRVYELCLLGKNSQKLFETIINILNNAIRLRELFKEFASLNVWSYDMSEKVEIVMKEFEKLKESHKICMRFITGFMDKKSKQHIITHFDDAYCRLDFNYYYARQR